MGSVNRARGIGGWLLVLCLLLLVYQPIAVGLVASSLLDSVGAVGVPVALLLLTRLLVTGFGIAAGLALAARRPGAVAIAKASLALSAATDLMVYATPYFPSRRAPGETPVYAAVSLAYYAIWLTYLFRSKRVRATFGQA